MEYVPKPIDTSQARLSERLERLTEQLAEHAHEVWSQQRLQEGWRWGAVRDDTRKTHPCLVPYAKLPESEKAYDRATAMGTLRAVLALGYQIEPPADAAASPAAADAAADLAAVERLLSERREVGLTALARLWQQHEAAAWSRRPAVYRALAERLLKLGAPLMAYDVTQEGLAVQAADVRLRQLQGLALARSGAVRESNRLLEELHREGHTDEETLGILARTYKDLWLATADPERRRHLDRASEVYTEAHRVTGGYWTGVNVATMAAVRGDRDTARAVATKVRAQCLDALGSRPADDPDAYWLLATLGEAALVLGDLEDAGARYAAARAAAGGHYGNLAATRRQALLLATHLGVARETIERWMPMPKVVVFAGHMIDQPGRARRRFPAACEADVRAAVEERLRPWGPVIGYAAAACGSDIIFLETVLELGGTIHVVLPYAREDFVRDSVDIIPGHDWRGRYETVLARAAQVITVAPQRLSQGGTSYEYTNQMLLGLSRMHADQLDSRLTGMAVWDGRTGDGPGGTASIIGRWQGLELDAVVVDLAAIVVGRFPDAAPPDAVSAGEASVQPGDDGTEVMALLFGDVKDFSKLTEQEIPRFVDVVLGLIGELTRSPVYTPIVKNTWGDGLYFVFRDVDAAARLALDLTERLDAMDFAAHGLPPTLSLRVGLHAGPVYRCMDPVTGQLTYTGTHVSRAARIEPITPPGHVYVSQAFAALGRLIPSRTFECDYVGDTPLAKGFGSFPMYHLRRR